MALEKKYEYISVNWINSDELRYTSNILSSESSKLGGREQDLD